MTRGHRGNRLRCLREVSGLQLLTLCKSRDDFTSDLYSQLTIRIVALYIVLNGTKQNVKRSKTIDIIDGKKKKYFIEHKG